MINLNKDEVDFLKDVIGMDDPFNTIKSAESRLKEMEYRLEKAKEEVKKAEAELLKLQQRDDLIKKLKEKLNE